MQLLEKANPGAVNRTTGIFRRVKVVGQFSKNNRYYPPDVLREAAGLYEGVAVNIDHVKNGDGRGYASRFGVLRNPRFEDGSVWADLHANPKHPLFESVAWDAENGSPIGLSHDCEARTRWDGEKKRNSVESISRVVSVDIVASPATTNTLYESDQAAECASFIDRLTRDSQPHVFENLTPIIPLGRTAESTAEYFPHNLPIVDLTESQRAPASRAVAEFVNPFISTEDQRSAFMRALEY